MRSLALAPAGGWLEEGLAMYSEGELDSGMQNMR